MTAPHAGGPTTGAATLRALRRHPERIAFQWPGGALTYAATAELIGRMQAVLIAGGLRRGDRVALLGANRAELWCAMTAAQLCGAAATALHPRGGLADHLWQLDDAGVDTVVIDPQAFGERGGEIAAAGGRRVLTLGPAPYGADLLAAAQAAGSVTAQDLARQDDVASLNYTGGTTGRPKGVLRRHRASLASAVAVLAEFELPARPRYLAVAPISHVSGTKVLPTLARGGTVHLMPGFDPEAMLDVIAAQRITHTLLVPTMVYTLLDTPALARGDLASLELVLYGASAMAPARLAEGIDRLGPVFAQLYGQSECYPICVLPREAHDVRDLAGLAACGYPATGADVALLDDEDQPVAQGEAGEICVRAPWAMDEYWNQPAQTEAALRGGWLHTGDIARADDTGRLFMMDRKKDMIVTGGFNVYSREVEDALASHPAVASAAVVGAPDPRWGEAVTALVVRRAGAVCDAADLQRHVRTVKGPLHAPKRVDFVEALPVTSLGKIDKKALRARYWTGHDRQVG